jgi:hypothetical protein
MNTTFLIAVTAVTASVLHAATFSNSVSADSFVRAAAPSSNYGSSGANSISGASATSGTNANGAFDTFIRFNTFSMVTNFNALFGSNSWAITSAAVQVFEQGAPANALFNRGKGSFEIRWIANDGWIEGTGNPGAPASSGIVYTNEPTLLNSSTDISLGIYTNAGVDGFLTFSLPLPTSFISDMQGGGEVGLFMTAADPVIGFTFVSRSFTPATSRPILIVSATPRPAVAAVSITGSDLNLSCTNGIAGSTYVALTSSDLTTSITQWTPVATNILLVTGPFTMTVSNAFTAQARQQFYIVQSH